MNDTNTKKQITDELKKFKTSYKDLQEKARVIFPDMNAKERQWFESFLYNLNVEFDNFADNLNEILDSIKEEDKKLPNVFKTLNSRQYKILTYLKKYPNIVRREYCTMFNISAMTAFRDLKDLEQKGLIFGMGAGKGRKFGLKD
ncbi:DeoR family transcriptional regulator [bacterium]|nr:MAG: DeoR family transcriptional regulator [bacterium]